MKKIRRKIFVKLDPRRETGKFTQIRPEVLDYTTHIEINQMNNYKEDYFIQK